MVEKYLSPEGLGVIDQYGNFKIGEATASIPYFNNKTTRTRFGLRAHIGKGSPKDIHDEIESMLVKSRIAKNSLTHESLQKVMVDGGIGVDCSAFAYYILEEVSKSQGQGTLNRHLSFVNCRSPISKMSCYLRPVENCDVSTLANDKNSRIVPLNKVEPGDIITMVGGPENGERNHVLVIHKTEYDEGIPKAFYYSHAVSYPEDGLYSGGIKQGKIEITLPAESILKQNWSESGSVESGKRIFERALVSKTEVRRLKWLN